MFTGRGTLRGSSHDRLQSISRSDEEAQSRLENVRGSMNRLFSGRSRVGGRRDRAANGSETPKPTRPLLGLYRLPSTRLHIPYLTRTNTSSSVGSNTSSNETMSARNGLTPTSSRTSRRNNSRPQNDILPTVAPEARLRSGRRFVGVDPAELHLAQLAESGRRRRAKKSRPTSRTCGPQIKNRKIRAKLFTCFISGLFLALVLTIYLALALSNRDESQEFHVLLILIILVITVFFCHSLIRLCMMINHPPSDDQPSPPMPDMFASGGYANPVVPIQVALARDEEAAGIESEATKLPPPAYGLWRESVRVDPNRLFWQRNAEAPLLERSNSSSSGRSSNSDSAAARPPSYISEDGVEYVVEAAPRSTAPLPPHPSERGRVPGQTWPMLAEP